MKIIEDGWLTSIFGYPVFKVGVLSQNPEDNNSAESFAGLSRHIAGQSQALYYAKVSTDEVGYVRKLSDTGFYAVDVNVTFGMDAEPSSNPSKPAEPSSCHISEASRDHYWEILDIAASSFRFSRFHLDPLIPEAVANRIKHDWVLSYTTKSRGDKLFAALQDGKPVGFLAAIAGESEGASIRTIDLIGVKKSHQGQGIGRTLSAFFVDYYKNKCDRLIVGTQVANIPSMRLYQKMGFSIINSQYVLHSHIIDGHVRK